MYVDDGILIVNLVYGGLIVAKKNNQLLILLRFKVYFGLFLNFSIFNRGTLFSLANLENKVQMSTKFEQLYV